MGIALTNARVIDGLGSTAVEDLTIEIDGSKIASVGGGSDLRGHDLYDLSGLTVIPGLIDAHVHLTFSASTDPGADLIRAQPADIARQAQRNAHDALMSGVTTVRDCGSPSTVVQELRDRVIAGALVGPRILASGPPVTTPRGHLWFMGGEATGPRACSDVVRRLVDEDVDLIKVMASGGHMTPGTDPASAQLSLDELTSIVRTAHKLERPVTAHAHGAEAIEQVVTAGVDCIEHCSWLGASGPDLRPQVLSAIVRQGIVISPAVGVNFRESPSMVYSDHDEQEYLRFFQQHRYSTTQTMWKAGATIIAGTDAGVRNNRFPDFYKSLRTFADKFEMGNSAAITAATSVAAKAIGLADVTGAIVPGLEADIVVLGGDPIDNLDNLADVRLVIRGGSVVFSSIAEHAGNGTTAERHHSARIRHGAPGH